MLMHCQKVSTSPHNMLPPTCSGFATSHWHIYWQQKWYPPLWISCSIADDTRGEKQVSYYQICLDRERESTHLSIWGSHKGLYTLPLLAFFISPGEHINHRVAPMKYVQHLLTIISSQGSFLSSLFLFLPEPFLGGRGILWECWENLLNGCENLRSILNGPRPLDIFIHRVNRVNQRGSLHKDLNDWFL